MPDDKGGLGLPSADIEDSDHWEDDISSITDVDDVMDLHGNELREHGVPPEVDLGEVREFGEYNEGVEDEEYDDILPSVETRGSLPEEPFEEDNLEPLQHNTLLDELPRARTNFDQFYEDDDSGPLKHAWTPFPISAFQIALRCWVEDVGISRSQYTTLTQVLRLPAVDLPAKLDALLSSLSTFKKAQCLSSPFSL